MNRLWRYLLAGLLLTCVMALAWLTMTESGLHWVYQRAESYLPPELRVDKIEGRLIGPITLTDVEYQQNGAVIKAAQMTLDWRPAALLMANIAINRLHIRSLHIVLPKKTAATATPQPLPQVQLPWRIALKHVQVDGVHVTQAGQSYALQQVSLQAGTIFRQVTIDQLTLAADNYRLTLDGELQPRGNYAHALQLRWQATLPSQAMLQGTGELTGNIHQTRLTQQLRGPLQLTLEAQLSDVLSKLAWQARAEVTAFDIAQLNAAWPALSGKLTVSGHGDLATATLSGNLAGQYPELGPVEAGFRLQRLGDNTIAIDRLQLQTAKGDRRLQARGQWQPAADGGSVDLALQWQNLRWPLKGNAWFDSAIGSGWITGDLQHYRLGLATDRPWPQAPPSFWYASADGDRAGLQFHSLRITALDGEANATGRLAWSPQLVWQAQATVTDIDPVTLLPPGPEAAQWSGRLKAKLTSRGRIESGQVVADADIRQLTGKLRGYPVSLNSRLGWRNNGLDIESFDFHSGSARVKARGRVSETLQLNWSIAASDVAELYPQAQGEFQAQGQLRGSRTAPIIDASIKGKALRLPDYELGAIDARVAMDLFHWQQLDIRLAAEALKLKGYALQSLNIEANNQGLVAKAVSPAATANLELKGETQAGGWQGRIERADFHSQHFADWQLKSPATLNISNTVFVLDPLCWQSSQAAQVCAALHRNTIAGNADARHDKMTWQAHLDLSKLPLQLFSEFLPDKALPSDLTLIGTVNGGAELQYLAPDQLQGQAHIDLPPGRLSYPLVEGERRHWDYRSGTATISLNAQGLEATAELTTTQGDHVQGRFALPQAKLLALDRQQQRLKARAQMTIQDLGIIEALVPEVQDMRGDVELNLAVNGTLAQPKFSGQARLHNGALRIPRLGLSINQLSFNSKSEGFEKVDFHLDAHSGEGKLAIQGQTLLDSSAGWPTDISIKGKEFEASRIPEARVLVSPDLRVKLQNHSIDIKGDVHIPYAKLQPKDLTTAARVSNDVVIVGSEQAPEKKWSINTQVRLTLGERVSFYGFGFEGRIGGSLLLVDEPGQLTTARGELTIPEGRYRAYGQRLDVEHGRLLYTGGPVTNPGLDLRAVRHIGEVTAGLKVKGSLNQPQAELFSVPAMGQTDALSYLMFGRPIENASGEEGATMAKAALALGLSGGNQLARSLTERFGLDEMRVEGSEQGGQASLVMGRYLSPKLYVSYGVGLIESFNTLTVRYRISDKWQLKGESGEYQGADILYTIDR